MINKETHRWAEVENKMRLKIPEFLKPIFKAENLLLNVTALL